MFSDGSHPEQALLEITQARATPSLDFNMESAVIFSPVNHTVIMNQKVAQYAGWLQSP